MSQKIYVGNLNYATTEESLTNCFSQFGEVLSSIVIKDRATGQSKGFGFVEFAEAQSADAAIEGMNGKELDGRRLRVNMAEDKPRRDRPHGGFNRDRSFNRDGGREQRSFGEESYKY